MNGLIVGIDVGGTFTDAVAADPSRGLLCAVKVPSRPDRPASAFLNGLERVLASIGATPEAVGRIVHGTTIATNAVLEHKGATLGILTTRGFEDILAIGRMKRTEMYNLDMDPEEPLFLAPRRRIVGIPERVDAGGAIVEPLDEGAVVREVQRLRDDYGVGAVAVCYLFSFLNAEHEARTGALLRRHFPDLPFSLSSLIDPKFREYERLVVTAFDAYLRPIIDTYVRDLERDVETHGFRCSLQIMQSNGGITSARTALERPVGTILSGPAAGVVAAVAAGRAAGFQDLVTLDMGGTSFDVALVRGGEIGTRAEGRIDKYPLRVPMVDVHTIGAGGGSIAFLDPAGGLKVGPESAGALPGPACYGRGGEEPTVTDASVLLGYLNPITYAGGGVRLHPELAREAIDSQIARPLGLDVLRAAWGIHEIVNTQMSEAVRLVSVRRGYDLRGIALVAMGGAGPTHAGRLLKLLEARAVIVPPRPGVGSAYGLLMADIRHECSRAYRRRLGEASFQDVAALFADIDARGLALMRSDGVSPFEVIVRRYAEMRYVGQSYELDVALPDGNVVESTPAELRTRFHEAHNRIYGHNSPTNEIEFIAVSGVFIHRLPPPPRDGGDRRMDRQAVAAHRAAYFGGPEEYRDTPVFDRFSLSPGATISGPAILDQNDTTTVVYPAQVARMHESGNLIITSEERQGGGP